MCKKCSFIATILFLISANLPAQTVRPILLIDGNDFSEMPGQIAFQKQIPISITGQTSENCQYSVKSENQDISIIKTGWLYTPESDFSTDTISLYANKELIYQLVLFNEPQSSAIIVFGLTCEQKRDIAKNISICTELGESNKEYLSSQNEITSNNETYIMMNSLSSYDVTLTGVHRYNTSVAYSEQTILANNNAYLVYDCNLTLTNCILDVNGCVEFNGDITLTNSQIRVKGVMKCKPGIQIMETGASNIQATGDTEQAGKISIEGNINNPIIIISDYTSTDSEFIIIDANSSANSSLKYIDFYGGWINIQLYNKRLNNTISNCCFFGAEYAIWQDGIQELTTVSFSLFCQNYISIYASIDGTSRTITYPLIDNVVINGITNETWGIILAGEQNVSYFDYFEITNSIITNCYCGWYFDANSIYPPNMSNLAYYENTYDDNYGHPDFVRNPIYLTQSPFEEPENPEDWPYFTNPESLVADVNLGYNIWQEAPEQMLTSIYSDSTPRINKGIGFGLAVPNGYISHLPDIITGDFDENGIVNNFDLYVFGKDWGSTYTGAYPIHYPDANGYSVADFDKGGIVDIFDLGIFASNWLSKNSIELTVDSNETLLTAVCQHIDGLSVQYYAFFLDGKFIGLKDPNDHPELIVEKMKYPQGPHYLKAIVITTNGNQFYTEAKEVLFNSPLSDLNFDESFDPDKKFILTGKVDAGYAANISVKNLDNQILWSDTFTEDFITELNPCAFLDGEIEFEITYNYGVNVLELFGGGQSMMMSSSSSSPGSSLVLGLDGPPDYRVAGLVLCMMYDGMKIGVGTMDSGTCWWAAKMMKQRNVIPIVMRGFCGDTQVSYYNIKRAIRKFPKLRYMHIYSHGINETDGKGIGGDVPRTILKFNDGIRPAINSRYWTDWGLQVPAGYEYISGGLENVHCLAQLGFNDMRVVVIEACYALYNLVTINPSTGLPTYVDPYGGYEYELRNNLNYYTWVYPYSDLCIAFNTFGSKQMILGGGDKVVKSSYYQYYSRSFNMFWECLGSGSTADTALTEMERIAVACKDVDDNWRARGNFDLDTIRLSSGEW